MPVRAGVTAVLVSHDGARWLPEVLAAVAAQTVPPLRVACADTGSVDDSALQLRAAFGAVLPLPRTTGYGAAVSAALATVPPTEWVWLLHDDCAPDPDALEALLAHAADSPSAALLGPKAVDWSDPRTLVEVGLTTGAGGSRTTGLDPGEPDQGQHDRPRDVLAVGTAGMLVRRDAWDDLGGLDRALPLLRDDLDLGWRANAAGHRVVVVPSARVRHARAAMTGQRCTEAISGRLAAVDRRHAVQVLLSHAPAWRLPLVAVQLVLVALLRAVLHLLGRRPRAAVDEVLAPVRVLGRPGRLRAARRARRAARRVPPRLLRPLLASRAAVLRSGLDAAAMRAAGRGGATGPPAPWLRRPAVLLGLPLVVLSLVAERSLLGGGALQGGRLLPAPRGATDLWQAFATADGEPRLAVLGALATLLLGRPTPAVDLVLLASVPLAALTAWAAAGRVVRQRSLRAWAAFTWALLPVSTGGLAAGRLDVAVVQVALPLLLVHGWSVISRDPRRAGWWRAWAVGLGMTPVLAFAPQLWPLAVLLLPGTALVVVAAVGRRGRPAAVRRLVASAVAVTAAVPVLLPWTWLPDIGALLHGPGRLGPQLAAADLPAWHLLLLSPGGPATPALSLTAGLVLGALGGLLGAGRPRVAAGGWALALAGLAYGLVLARSAAHGQPVWPGVGLQVAGAGLVLAGLVGADGLKERLARASFGRRQLLAVVVVAAAAVTPVLCAAAWLARGADDPLRRGGGAALPPFVRADLAQSGGRALLVSGRPDGSVGYAVTGPDGARLGDGVPAGSGLDVAVAELVTPRGVDVSAALAAERVSWVSTGDPELVRALDASAALIRHSGRSPLLWRVTRASDRQREDDRLETGRIGAQALSLLTLAVLAAPPRRRPDGLLP